MQKLISKYAAAAHLALVVVSPLFLLPFCAADVTATVIVNLSLIAALWILMEPSRRRGEMLHDARSRVAGDIVRDPLFWLFAVVAVLSAIRWANGPVVMDYDAEEVRWFVREPPVPWLPTCAAGWGKAEFATVIACWVLSSGFRHALGKSARNAFLFVASLLAAVAAVVAIWAADSGVRPALAAARADYTHPSFTGLAFALLATGGVAAFAGAVELEWKRLGLLFMFAIGGCLAGMFVFSPPLAVLAGGIAAAVTFIASLPWLARRVRKHKVAAYFVMTFASVAVAVALTILLAPEKIVEARFDAITRLDLLPDRFAGCRDVLSGVSLRAWLAHPWLGTGVGSFNLDLYFDGVQRLWKMVSTRQSAALSGWWNLLAERGLVGVAMLALPFIFMFWTLASRILSLFAEKTGVPGFVAGLAACVLAAVEGFTNCSFMRPESLMALVSLFAISAASLASAKRRAKIENTGDEGNG